MESLDLIRVYQSASPCLPGINYIDPFTIPVSDNKCPPDAPGQNGISEIIGLVVCIEGANSIFIQAIVSFHKDRPR